MEELIEKMMAVQKTAGKKMSRETKLEQAGLLVQVVLLLVEAIQNGGYAAISSFSNLFSSHGKLGRAIRLGILGSFSALVVFSKIFQDARLGTPEEDVESKCDLVAGGFNIQIKSGKDKKIFRVCRTREDMESFVAQEKAGLEAFKANKLAEGKWDNRQDQFLAIQIARAEKALGDWDLLAQLPGKPLYVIFPWDLSKKDHFDRIDEIVEEVKVALNL